LKTNGLELTQVKYTLTVTSGSSTVTSSPKGINCGKQCDHLYAVGTTITLTAKPSRTHPFLDWSGASSGTTLSCTLSIMGDRNVTATFQ